MEKPYNMSFEKDGDFCIGYVEGLPGANSQGETLEDQADLQIAYDRMHDIYDKSISSAEMRELLASAGSVT